MSRSTPDADPGTGPTSKAGAEPQLQVQPTARIPTALLVRLRGLLDEAFEGGFTDDDWEHALGGWHAVLMVGDDPVAHAAVVPRVMRIGDHTFASGYVEAVATAPGAQGSGHGSRVVRAVQEVIRREAQIGLLSTGAHGFYERLGWERWRGPTYVLRDGRRLRTPDDDSGLMVLRFGHSAEVARTEPIVCRARSGDDW